MFMLMKNLEGIHSYLILRLTNSISKYSIYKSVLDKPIANTFKITKYKYPIFKRKRRVRLYSSIK